MISFPASPVPSLQGLVASDSLITFTVEFNDTSYGDVCAEVLWCQRCTEGVDCDSLDADMQQEIDNIVSSIDKQSSIFKR